MHQDLSYGSCRKHGPQSPLAIRLTPLRSPGTSLRNGGDHWWEKGGKVGNNPIARSISSHTGRRCCHCPSICHGCRGLGALQLQGLKRGSTSSRSILPAAEAAGAAGAAAGSCSLLICVLRADMLLHTLPPSRPCVRLSMLPLMKGRKLLTLPGPNIDAYLRLQYWPEGHGACSLTACKPFECQQELIACIESSACWLAWS